MANSPQVSKVSLFRSLLVSISFLTCYVLFPSVFHLVSSPLLLHFHSANLDTSRDTSPSSNPRQWPIQQPRNNAPTHPTKSSTTPASPAAPSSCAFCSKRRVFLTRTSRTRRRMATPLFRRSV